MLNPRRAATSAIPLPAQVSRRWLEGALLECAKCHMVAERRSATQRHCPECRASLMGMRIAAATVVGASAILVLWHARRPPRPAVKPRGAGGPPAVGQPAPTERRDAGEPLGRASTNQGRGSTAWRGLLSEEPRGARRDRRDFIAVHLM